MNSKGTSHGSLMLVLCILPLLLFFVLALTAVSIHPLWIPLVLILCCLAMFLIVAGSSRREQTEYRPHFPEEEVSSFSDSGVPIDDVFRVRNSRTIDGVYVQEGELLLDPTDAYALLEERTQNHEVTPILEEGRAGESVLIWLPTRMELEEKKHFPWLNLVLLLATLLTTTWAGAWHAGVNLFAEPARFTAGLPYSLSLLLILGAHELGHYVAARIHRMRVTLPYFIPVPFGLGTFGAFIQLKSPAKNRRALFDVAVAGPLAGLVVAIPALWVGLRYSQVLNSSDMAGSHAGTGVGSSLLFALTAKLALGNALTDGHLISLHPLAFAGWLGLLVTALNLLPIGQLDGGHIADAMFGSARSAAIGTGALVALFLLGLFVWTGLLMWAFLIYFVAGSKGLPPLNNLEKLDRFRVVLGVVVFVLLAMILIPVPHRFYEGLGIHCPYL